MFYRIIVDLAFTDPAFPQSIYNHAQGLFDHAHTINPGKISEEKGRITLEKCYHDQEGNDICEAIEHQETS